MFVPNIGGFDGIGSGFYLENQIHDFFERGIGHMRHVPAAEAHMISNAVLRDSSERVVQRLDAQISPLTIFLGTLLNQMIVHVGQHCIVDLEQQARVVNGAILFAERVGDGVDVIVFVWIVFVHAVVSRARRSYCSKEDSLTRDLLQSLREMRERAIEGRVIQIADRPDASFVNGPRRKPGKLLENGFGKPLPVATEPNDGAQLVGADFESADSLQNIVGPALLSIFAVADNVDSNLGLLADHIQGLLTKYAVVLRHVFWLFTGRSEIAQFFGTYQAAYVGCQDTIFAALHRLVGFHPKDNVHSCPGSIQNFGSSLSPFVMPCTSYQKA